jgi:uncharacterized membrane protein YgcG
MNMPPRLARAFLIALLPLALIAPSACSSADDDTTASPAAFVSPVDHQTYCRWINNPHECDNSGLRAASFPIPTDQPVQQPGMSATDFLILNALFQDGMMYHSFYYRPWYYNNYIGPAWNRYPGYTSYGYGHQPIQRITNVATYNTTVVDHVNTKYASQEKAAEPKAVYKTANGKTYSGKTVPQAAFEGTNVPVRSPASSGSSVTTPKGNTARTGSSSSSGKGSYGGSSSGGSRSSGGGRR